MIEAFSYLFRRALIFAVVFYAALAVYGYVARGTLSLTWSFLVTWFPALLAAAVAVLLTEWITRKWGR